MLGSASPVTYPMGPVRPRPPVRSRPRLRSVGMSWAIEDDDEDDDDAMEEDEKMGSSSAACATPATTTAASAATSALPPRAPAKRTIDKVEEGKQYMLIITTTEGLYRYNLEDGVEVTGFLKGTPLLGFVHRNKFLDLTGEKCRSQR